MMANFDSQQNQVINRLHKVYNFVTSSERKINALENAIFASRDLIIAIEHSIKGGLRVNIDLINAREQLLMNQKDLYKARYNFFLGILHLRALASVLEIDDMRKIAVSFI